MARFRLTNKHYLVVPGTEWEYKEIDQSTGKQRRMVHEVPLYLDPNDPSDWNYPVIGTRGNVIDGQIIVTTKPNEQYPRDLHFIGHPTPDMEPLDEEASALIAEMAPRWKHPIESLSGNFGETLANDLQKQIAQLQAQTGNKLEDLIKKMSEEIESLKAQLAQKPPAAPADSGTASDTGRRV